MNTALSHQSHALLALGLHLVFSKPPRAPNPLEEARDTLLRFVACQNAHDCDGVAALLWDSPEFVWVARRRQVRGATAAIAQFRKFFAGTWCVAPEMACLKATEMAPGRVQIQVPMVFSRGAAGRIAQQEHQLCSLVLRRDDAGWRIASVAPVA